VRPGAGSQFAILTFSEAVGVPKGTKIEVVVDGQGLVTSAKIIHPDYKKC
jgi:hypothetical protein